MSKNLMIVESPHKGETIAKYLDKSFKVMSSQGHIRDIEGVGKNSIGIDFKNQYTPNYAIEANKTQLVQSLRDAAAKATKWNRTVLEACKQCGVNHLPVVETPQSYAAFLQRQDLPETKLQCAIVPHARPLRQLLETARTAGIRECVLLIGPEGDFSPAEYTAAEAVGYAPTSLGPIILRVETAVFLAVAAARYALDA